MCVCLCVFRQSCPTLCNLWTIARQAPLSVTFSQKEFWSGLTFAPSRNLPHPGIEPASPASPVLAGGFFTSEPPGNSGSRWHWGHMAWRGRLEGWRQCWGWWVTVLEAAGRDQHGNTLLSVTGGQCWDSGPISYMSLSFYNLFGGLLLLFFFFKLQLYTWDFSYLAYSVLPFS